jgi:hypothetical protein
MDACEICSKAEFGLAELRQRAFSLPITMRCLPISESIGPATPRVIDRNRL